MRISTQTDIIFPAFGIDEGMKIFKEAGFDALDFFDVLYEQLV